MTNTQLNEMSLSELSQLRNKITEMMRVKQLIKGKLNLDNLSVGMTVEYIGSSNKIKGETFTIKKINRVNVLCESNITGQLWNIKPANLKEYKEIDLDLTKFL